VKDGIFIKFLVGGFCGGSIVIVSESLQQNTSFIPTPTSLHVFYYYEQ
jgi:hypothetical protein